MEETFRRRSVCLAVLCSLMLLGCVAEGVPGVHPTENPLSAAEDHLLILEGEANVIFAATSTTHNSRSVWREVDSQGNFGSYYIYWFKDHQVWNFDFDTSEYPVTNRVAYGGPSNRTDPFPEDGMPMDFWNIATVHSEVHGYLDVASADVWTACRPQKMKVSSPTMQPKAFGRAERLIECSRKAVADDSRTTAVMLTGGECFAFTAADITTQPSESRNDLACVLGLVLLPGQANAEKTHLISGPTPINAAECAIMVQKFVPKANGMSFNGDTGVCEAVIGMKGVHSTDAGEWKSAFLIPPGEEPTPTTPTDIPKTSSSSTESTPATSATETTDSVSMTTGATDGTESASTAMPTPDITATTEGSATTHHVVPPIVHVHKHHMSTMVLAAIVAGAVGGLALLIAAAFGLYAMVGSSHRRHDINVHEVEAQRGRMEPPTDRETEAIPTASLYA